MLTILELKWKQEMCSERYIFTGDIHQQNKQTFFIQTYSFSHILLTNILMLVKTKIQIFNKQNFIKIKVATKVEHFVIFLAAASAEQG